MSWGRRWAGVLPLTVGLLAAGCATTTPDPGALAARYRAAVADAETAEPDEIDVDLLAVTAASTGLLWEGEPGRSRVRVVTWTSWDGYDPHVGSRTELSREVWVTLVPELRRFCSALGLRSPDRRTLRLEQLLGLPPGDGKDRFVELWVEPGDLFRPCPDPEINDHECGLSPPRSAYTPTTDPAYREWFDDLRATSYSEDGYPWTRLGYTYDWGSRKSEVGLSELVIRGGATVGVVSVTPTQGYCRRGR